jgi:CRP-like cAMP-binding protein
MDRAAELAKTSLFCELDDTALNALANRVVQRRYRKGNVVFVQGEQGDRCFAIVTGAVKISAYHSDGREAVLAILGPGDVFGELSPFDEAPRSADATAAEDAEVLSLDGDALREAIRHHPEIGLALLRVLSKRLRTANESFQDVAFFDVGGRLARKLAELATTHGVTHEGGVLIDMPVSQEQLAQMIGATRESVNKALATLTRRGLVKRAGKRYLVSDIDELRSRAR